MSDVRRFKSDIKQLFYISDRPLLTTADVGFSVFQRCEALLKKIFDAQGVKNSIVQKNRINDVFDKIENMTLSPKKNWEYQFELKKDENIQGQLDLHHEMALYQAVYAVYIWKSKLPATTNIRLPYNENHIVRERLMLVADMITAMDHSGRHLVAAKLIMNIDKKYYSGRTSKGGHSRSKSLAKEDKNYLLWVMVKGIMYNDPAILKRIKRNPREVSYQLAERIFNANREYQMLHISDLNGLKGEVHTIVLERLNEIDGLGDFQGYRRILAGRFNGEYEQYRTEQTKNMELEAARNQGVIEGIRNTLIHQVKIQFESIPDTVLDYFLSIKTVDDLQECLKRLPNATTPEDVISEPS